MQILIADDEPVSRHLLQAYLHSWGYQVVAAVNGEEAWRLFEASGYPMVVTDWMMPRMDGLELIRRIRATQREQYVYVILVTARSRTDDVIKGMEAGADDFVTKPFDRDELRVRLRAGERIVHLELDLLERNRRLRETQAALIQSEKLASLGQLAAGLAHEINNPLAYVINNLAVLRRDVFGALDVLNRYREAQQVPREPGRAEELARLEQEIELPYLLSNLDPLFDKSLAGLRRVRDIVRNLCDFARLDEAEVKEADLNAALRSTLEILHHEIETKQVRIETRFQDLPSLLCHPGKLNQVFVNLLANAVQACEPGGRIQVSTHAEAGAAIRIDFEDNGCGIRPEHQAHLFEPFFTTKPVGQGTGLGLWVSHGIIRDHGGSITVASTPGQGSLFRVRLPLDAQAKT